MYIADMRVPSLRAPPGAESRRDETREEPAGSSNHGGAVPCFPNCSRVLTRRGGALRGQQKTVEKWHLRLRRRLS